MKNTTTKSMETTKIWLYIEKEMEEKKKQRKKIFKKK